MSLKSDIKHFYNCTNLRYITLPENLLYIDEIAFNGCSNISFVSYFGPESDFICDKDAFYGCDIDVICVPLDSNLKITLWNHKKTWANLLHVIPLTIAQKPFPSAMIMNGY